MTGKKHGYEALFEGNKAESEYSAWPIDWKVRAIHTNARSLGAGHNEFEKLCRLRGGARLHLTFQLHDRRTATKASLSPSAPGLRDSLTPRKTDENWNGPEAPARKHRGAPSSQKLGKKESRGEDASNRLKYHHPRPFVFSISVRVVVPVFQKRFYPGEHLLRWNCGGFVGQQERSLSQKGKKRHRRSIGEREWLNRKLRYPGWFKSFRSFQLAC